MRFIARLGIVLESARHRAVANLADEVLGHRRHGSWWGHARGKEFFRLTRQVRSDPDVLVCSIVAGKVTYVHRRLWPALVRLASVVGAARAAAIREVHTKSGAHRTHRTPLRSWMPAWVYTQAAKLTLKEARAQLSAAYQVTWLVD